VASTGYIILYIYNIQLDGRIYSIKDATACRSLNIGHNRYLYARPVQ